MAVIGPQPVQNNIRKNKKSTKLKITLIFQLINSH